MLVYRRVSYFDTLKRLRCRMLPICIENSGLDVVDTNTQLKQPVDRHVRILNLKYWGVGSHQYIVPDNTPNPIDADCKLNSSIRIANGAFVLFLYVLMIMRCRNSPLCNSLTATCLYSTL